MFGYRHKALIVFLSCVALLGCPPDDLDEDGFPAYADCDDGDAGTYPGAEEQCDSFDSDCDGSLVDEFSDMDNDAAPDCIDPDMDGDQFDADADCDDADPSIYPDAPELCDEIDSDCDGDLVDGDLDLDEDGIPDCIEDDADGDGAVAADDCDDSDPTTVSYTHLTLPTKA